MRESASSEHVVPPQCAFKKLSLRWRRSNCRRAVASASNWFDASPLFFSSFLLARLALLFLHLAALSSRKSVGADESGVWDADKLGEGDADGSTVGRARSARGVG